MMPGAVAPYVAIAAAASCIWALPWVQGPTSDGRPLDPSAAAWSADDSPIVSLSPGTGEADSPSGASSGRSAHRAASTKQAKERPAGSGRDTSPPSPGLQGDSTRSPSGFAPGKATPEGQSPATFFQVPVAPSVVTTRPQALAIPSRGIRGPVVPVGLDDNRGVIVPEDVTVLGWYDGSKPLGAAQGATVLVGHRDSRVQGYGTFNDIESLKLGSRLIVTGEDGSLHTYAVSSVEFIAKTDLPQRARSVFTRKGPPHLTLITCGGAFDEAARSYLSNVVVTAVPVDG